ncbi:MAG: terminase small subunit [Burkholderiales bacterium]|nr:terminase small subunit [Burkholderiales bacterium]
MTPKQARFVAEYAVDGSAAAAARRAGYSPRSARVNGPRLLTNAAVREALAVSQQETAQRLELDRQRVLAGLMEAVETARAQADPHALIRAWSEIGKLLGFYAPERKSVEVSTATSARMRAEIEALSDEELLALAETTLPK